MPIVIAAMSYCSSFILNYCKLLRNNSIKWQKKLCLPRALIKYTKYKVVLVNLLCIYFKISSNKTDEASREKNEPASANKLIDNVWILLVKWSDICLMLSATNKQKKNHQKNPVKVIIAIAIRSNTITGISAQQRWIKEKREWKRQF